MTNVEILRAIFIIDRCTYTPEEFFKNTLPGCSVEDGYIVNYNDMTYEMVKYNPVGILVQRDLQFYTLELNIK